MVKFNIGLRMNEMKNNIQLQLSKNEPLINAYTPMLVLILYPFIDSNLILVTYTH
jgi:hypothetical protein